jgi:mono/diheme cytochrome c family protein
MISIRTHKAAALTLTMIVTLGLAACQKSDKPGTTPGTTPGTEAGNEFDVSYLEMGKEIAETHCAACHTIKPLGASPRADAPPLRTVLSTYNPSALADDFREHIHVGHPDMPDFDFTVLQTEGLLAYLTSIQEMPE